MHVRACVCVSVCVCVCVCVLYCPHKQWHPSEVVVVEWVTSQQGEAGVELLLWAVLCSYSFYAGRNTLPVDPQNTERTQAIQSCQCSQSVVLLVTWFCEEALWRSFIQWCQVTMLKCFKVLLKYYLSRVSVLYFTIYMFDNFYFYSTAFLKKIWTFYSPIHLPWLPGQQNHPIHALIKRMCGHP